MNHIKKSWLGAVLVAITFGMIAVAAPPSTPAPKPAPQSEAPAATSSAPASTQANEDEDSPHFLATMAVTGKVRYSAASARECGTLSFQTQERTTLFTERPTRQAVSTPTNELVQNWSEAYGPVAPNAQLQLFKKNGASQGLVVQLKSAPTWDAATRTVSFPNTCLIETADDTQKRLPVGEFEFGSLFIDSAKIGAWNSCYPKDDNDSTGNAEGVCFEQWGSYPASCQRAGGVGHTSTARGKRCKQVCNVTTCPKGCFRKYRGGTSVSNVASAYECSN